MDLTWCLLSGVSSHLREMHTEKILAPTIIVIAIDTKKEKARRGKDKYKEEGHCTWSGGSGKASPRK